MALKLSKTKNEAYKKEAIEALKMSVGPAYTQLISFLKEQSKRATKEDGACTPTQHTMWVTRMPTVALYRDDTDRVHPSKTSSLSRLTQLRRQTPQR